MRTVRKNAAKHGAINTVMLTTSGPSGTVRSTNQAFNDKEGQMTTSTRA